MADAHPDSDPISQIEHWANDVAAVEDVVITRLVAEPRVGQALIALHARRPLPFGKPLSIRATRRIRGRIQMKVLRQGTVPDRRIRGTCGACRTSVEFLPEEGRSGEDPQDQRSVGLVVVRCPTCGAEVVGRERRS